MNLNAEVMPAAGRLAILVHSTSCSPEAVMSGRKLHRQAKIEKQRCTQTNHQRIDT
jgi:hypothetical protein